MAIGYRSISALKAIRLSDKTRTALGDSYAQLSSGQRINKPSVDPGGLAVSLSLGAEAKISSRAKLNTEDGVSLASYAEAAFGSATDIVQRMNELANQAANGILKTDQRNALNTEFAALREELYRIQKSSSFNGRAVNYGSATTANAKYIGSTSGVVSSDMSSDGRYLYFIDSSGNLKVRDATTDTTSTLATGLASSAQVAVSAAGDKVAYSNGDAGLFVLDRLTGVTINPILSTSSLQSLEISGDGSMVAFSARLYYDSEGGGGEGSDGYYHITTYDLNSGTIRSDGGFYGFLPSSSPLSVSYNGDYIAIQGQEDYQIGTSQEVYVFGSDDMSNVLWSTSTSDRLVDSYAVDNSGNVYAQMSTALLKLTASSTSGTNILGPTQGFTNLLGLTDAGNTLTFTSTSNLTGDNKSGVAQIFKYDLSTLEYRQISAYTSSTFANQVSSISDDGFSAISISGSGYYLSDLSPTLNINIDTGSGLSGQVGVSIVSLDGAARGLKGYSISTAFEARSVASALSRTLEGLELGRAKVGAATSRLGSASRALAVKGTEQQAAYARITDVDTAESVANMVRLQVLSKAQTAVLAQASKLVPETALKLLKAA